jgi:hypothetical protein
MSDAEERVKTPKTPKSRGGKRSKRGASREKISSLTPEEQAAQKAAVRAKFVKNHCTTLIFFWSDGKKREVIIEDRIASYHILQREMSRILGPKSSKILIIQDSKGERLTADNFVKSAVIKIRELTTKSMIPQYPPQVDIMWETTPDYSGNPSINMDKVKAQEDKLKGMEKAMEFMNDL